MHRALRRDHLQAVLLMLQGRDDNRRQELDEYPRVLPEGDNLASQSPIYDPFVADEGAHAILRLTNITPREINTLWGSVRPHITRYWNVGRGRRSQFKGNNVLFMTLVALKNGGRGRCYPTFFTSKRQHSPRLSPTSSGLLLQSSMTTG
ncbi:hypothetical protein DVH05_008348 [Phytophthora capsici]|nr:hypothetical protein DVH05_008348 [Phytophthora capsici]